MKIFKFIFFGCEFIGREVGVDVNFFKVEVNVQVGVGEGKWEEFEVKLKKFKIKMFKYIFFKFKGKGGVIGLFEVFIFGFKGDLKSLKVSLGFLEGEVEVEVFLFKGKFFLFKSKKL